MGRKTVYNSITSPEKISAINPNNIALMNDFLDYLKSVGRASSTIKNYKADLLVFFCWCEDNLNNKYFVDLTKREISRFQNHALNVWQWSPNRLYTVKAALSSLSNFIENILDDEIRGYKPIIRKIENPPKQVVREKTVLSEEDVEKILNYLIEGKEYDKACFFALAAFSGRRKSELCRFKVSDVSDDRLVCGGALYKTAPIKTKGRGVNGKQLCCYVLARKFKPYLDLWMQYRAEHNIDSIWLFPKSGDDTQQISTSSVDSWSDTLSRVTGLEIYPHAFRHYFCTMLSRAGLPDSVITEIVGWESSDLCKVYIDIEADDQIGLYFDEDGNIVSKNNSPGLSGL